MFHDSGYDIIKIDEKYYYVSEDDSGQCDNLIYFASTRGSIKLCKTLTWPKPYTDTITISSPDLKEKIEHIPYSTISIETEEDADIVVDCKVNLNQIECGPKSINYLWQNHKNYVLQFQQCFLFEGISDKIHVLNDYYVDEMGFCYCGHRLSERSDLMVEIYKQGTIDQLKKYYMNNVHDPMCFLSGPDQVEKYDFLISKGHGVHWIKITDETRDLWLIKLKDWDLFVYNHDQEIRKSYPDKKYKPQSVSLVLKLIKKGNTEFILDENNPLIKYLGLTQIGDNLYKLTSSKKAG